MTVVQNSLRKAVCFEEVSVVCYAVVAQEAQDQGSIGLEKNPSHLGGGCILGFCTWYDQRFLKSLWNWYCLERGEWCFAERTIAWYFETVSEGEYSLGSMVKLT